MSMGLGTLLVRIGADTSMLDGALASSGGKIAAFSKLGVGSLVALTTAAAGVAGLGVKSFMDFDAALNESISIMGDVSAEMQQKLSDTAREVGKATRFSAKEAAESYYFLVSAGMSAEATLEALPQVAQFAQAGMFDMATATDLLVDAQAALGLSSDNAAENLKNLTRVSDVLVGGNINANASVQQLSESLTNGAATAGKLAHQSIEDIVGVLSVFAEKGMKGAAAGTAYDIVLRDLGTAAANNKEVFEKMGVSVYDNEGQFRKMPLVIGEMEDAFKGMSDEQLKAALTDMGFQDRSVRFIKTLLGSSDAMADYTEKLYDMSGVTKDVAEKQLKTFSEQWGLLKGKLADVAIGIGEQLVPHLERLVGWLDKAMPTIEKWGGAFATAMNGIAGGLAMVFTDDSSLQGFSATFEAFGQKGIDVANNIRLVIDTVRGFIDEVMPYVQLFITEVQQVFDIIRTKVEENMPAIEGAGGMIGEVFAAVGTVLETVIPYISNFVGFLLDVAVPVFAEIWAAFGEAFDAIKGWVEENMPLIQETIAVVLDAIRGYWDEHGAAILEVVTTIWNSLKEYIGAAMAFIGDLIKLVMQMITGDWDGAWETMKGMAAKAWDLIKSLVRLGMDIVKGILTAGGAILTGIWSLMWNVISGLAGQVWEDIKGIVSRGWNSIKTTTSTLIGQVKTTISTKFTEIKTSITEKIQAAVSAVAQKFRDLKSTLSGILSDIKDTIVGPFAAVYDVIVGHSIVPDLVDEVVRLFGTMNEKTAAHVNEMVGTIVDDMSKMADYIRDEYEKLRDQNLDRLQEEKDDISDHYAALLDQTRAYYGEQMMLAEAAADGEIAALYAKLEEIDAAEQARKDAQAQAERDAILAKATAEQDAEEKAKLLADYDKAEADWQEELRKRGLQAEKDAIRDEIEGVRDRLTETKDALKEQEDTALAAINTAKDADLASWQARYDASVEYWAGVLEDSNLNYRALKTLGDVYEGEQLAMLQRVTDGWGRVQAAAAKAADIGSGALAGSYSAGVAAGTKVVPGSTASQGTSLNDLSVQQLIAALQGQTSSKVININVSGQNGIDTSRQIAAALVGY